MELLPVGRANSQSRFRKLISLRKTMVHLSVFATSGELYKYRRFDHADVGRLCGQAASGLHAGYGGLCSHRRSCQSYGGYPGTGKGQCGASDLSMGVFP
jgi:hypothetical protein